MTDIQKKILEKYQVRKTRKDKDAFIDFVKDAGGKMGYEVAVEKSGRGARNIVIGSPENAKVVYTAHYDTPVRSPMPNLITPKCLPLYLLYQLLFTAVLLSPALLLGFGLGVGLSLGGAAESTARAVGYFAGYGAFILTFLYLFILGPANKNTANDNTSGVTVIFEIMETLPLEMREKAAFILFDLEEMGLRGSSAYNKAHKEMMKSKLLINFDCVSEGKQLLLVLRKGAAPMSELLAECFRSEGEFSSEVATKGVVYPSDQKSFPCGVGVAMLKKTKRGLLYLSRIHTGRDTVYEEENIEFLVGGAVRLTEIL